MKRLQRSAIAFLLILSMVWTCAPAIAGEASAPMTESYYDCYSPILLSIHAEFNDSFGTADYLDYALYDIDGDGVLELIVLAGTCEADFVRRIYTVADGRAQYAGETFGGHSTLYECPEGGFYNMMAHMGYEEVYRVTYTNRVVSEELLLSKDVGEYGDYDSPGADMNTSAITDFGLLWEAPERMGSQ